MLIGTVLLSRDESFEASLENQRELHADMVRIGRFVEQFRSEEKRLPDKEILAEWLQGQELSSRLIESNLNLVLVDDVCVLGEETELPDDSHTYRICYWNNWTEEYAPETGAHTFATSMDDYRYPWWQWVGMIALMCGACALAAHLLLGAGRSIREDE